MNTKQFVGASIDEVLRDIREDLGDDAVILHTRKVVKGGLGGFFGKEMIEVTATDGSDDEDAPVPAATASLVNVVDEDETAAVAGFSAQLNSRLGANGVPSALPQTPVAPPAASAASAYARGASPTVDTREAAATGMTPITPSTSLMTETAIRPFPADQKDRTRAIIEAARAAMQANAAGETQATGVPAPPAFMSTGTTTADTRVRTPDWTTLPATKESPGAAHTAVTQPTTTPQDGAAPSRARLEEALAAARNRMAEAAARTAAQAAPTATAAAEAVATMAPVTVATPSLEPVEALDPLPGNLSVAAVQDTLPEVAYEPSVSEASAVAAPAQVAADHAPVNAHGTDRDASSYPWPELAEIREELRGAGIEPRYLDPFLDGVARNVLPFAADGDIRAEVRAALASRIPVPRDWKNRPAGQALAFVGQNGVGKSTVVRKLAWRMHQAGATIAIITTGEKADAQLASLADRLGVSYAHARDGAQLAAARSAVEDVDLILIDTPGCSHTKLDEMEALAQLLNPARIEEIHLVLPLAVPFGDLGDLSRRFRMAGVNRLTLTKADETGMRGNLVNVPVRLSKAVAFIADGQSATGELTPADPATIAKMLLP